MTLKATLRALALATAAVFPLLHAAPAAAAAPMAKTFAPGYYRMMLGDFEITVLSDGTVPLPVDTQMTNAKPEDVRKQLAQHFLKPPVETSVNGFLVNTGSKLVLIDTGAGSLFGPTLGRLAANLKASGYQPEQVDEIYITHMHGDHIGGLSADGKAVFPNAVVRADQHDADYWLSKANLEKAPDKDSFKGAMMMFQPYVEAGRFKPFNGSTDLVPGVKALAAHGHTPGHTTYVVESKGEKLVLWGDLMHVAAVQFAHPETTINFDSDNKAAAAERKKAYADAARGAYWIGAAHLSFPGVGHLRSEGKGYAFEPVNYLPLR
ncbi:MBL fold metallo-hydrolase [Oxalobacteraceae bacterium OM1]|nr:MBL fold metallo-hydrolase [Oxalobacteraceae bacterium OM1]